MRIVNWNLAWAAPDSRRGRLMRALLADVNADIAVLTEVPLSFLAQLGGHVCTSAADYGYRIIAGRRKAALWSNRPLARIDRLGSAALPTGRFVAADSHGVRCVVLCVPWAAAHVSTGRRDRRNWEEHMAYLNVLPALTPQWTSRTVLAGDFNQRRPRARQPRYVADALETTLGQFRWATDGYLPPTCAQTIDHVLTTHDLAPTGVYTLPDEIDGVRLSDHRAVVCDIEAATA